MEQLTEHDFHNAIIKSVETNNLDMVLQLLSFGHHFIVDHSSIECASRNGFSGCLKALLNHNGLQYYCHVGALESAAENGHVNCLKMLIPLVNPAYNNNYSLMVAAQNGHLECVYTLIPVSDMNNQDCMALEAASRGGHVDCLELLVKHCSVQQCDFALRSALLEGNQKCADILANMSDVNTTLSHLNAEHPNLSERWSDFEIRWCKKILLNSLNKIEVADKKQKKM